MSRILVALFFGGILAAQVKPANPAFEQGEIGVIPQGWMAPTTHGGFGVTLTDQNCRTGSQCALMTGLVNPPANAPFGNLMQSIPAGGYNLRHVRYRAAVRVEGAQTRAQMWLRLDRADGSMAFLENMGTRPITESEWKTYDIETDVPGDVSRLVFGVMLLGPGKAWVDDVSLDILAEIIKDTVEPAPRPLSSQGLTNLTAFSRLYGYVRFFHPSDQAARTDWETFAVEGVRKVEDAANPAELVERLRGLFEPIAPTVQVWAGSVRPQPAASAEAPEFLRYMHVGVGLPTTTIAMNIYKSWRERKQSSSGIPKPFEAELVPGITASVPLAVSVDAEGTLPHAGPAVAPPLYERSPDDRSTLLAAVIIAWNIFQHFYPYFDVVKTDWRAELPKALRTAANDPNGEAFTKTLQRLVAALHDGHGRVTSPRTRPMLTPSITMGWVENQFIVTRAKVEGVAPGDRVLKIDGKPMDQAATEAREIISGATEGWIRVRSASDLSLCNPETRHMNLELEPFAGPGTTKSVDLPCGPPKFKDPETYTEARPADKIAELEPGIFYVDLDRVGDKEWTDVVPRLEKAKGIIFDMRGYPSGPGIQSLAHLSDSATRSARWNVPTPTLPDRLDVPFLESGWPVPPQKPYFPAKRAFLTDGRAISYAETVMGIVENFKLGEIVGEPTAGTNGNVNPFKLPGGYTISWTGMKVLKHDGSQHHGIGILPTVPVSRTRKGVAEGKDELLLKAIEVVKRP